MRLFRVYCNKKNNWRHNLLNNKYYCQRKETPLCNRFIYNPSISSKLHANYNSLQINRTDGQSDGPALVRQAAFYLIVRLF